MSGPGGSDAARGIARGLQQVLAMALGEGASARTLEAARDLSQVLSLRGLDRLLAALIPYAGVPWPAGLLPVIGRVQQAAADCGRDGSVTALRSMDDELSLMAQAIERVAPAGTPATSATPPVQSRPAREPAVAEPISVPLREALEGITLPRESQELLDRVQVRPPVAGALRAALEWLIGEGPARPRPALACDGSALELRIDGIVFTGIQPAAQVLASVGGHLGPGGHRPGSWTLRVPVMAERDLFLMLEQGELRLALPWHAVARVRVVPTDTIEAMAQRQGLPVLHRIADSPRRAAEQPVVVVALGLKRACLVADRLVWRMPADPAAVPGEAPAAGIVRAVRTDEDELYWVLEPAWLLRGVAAPKLPDPGAASAAPKARPASPAPVVRALPPAPIPFPAPIGREPMRPEPAAPNPLRALEAQDVEPISADEHGEAAGAQPPSSATAAARPEAEPGAAPIAAASPEAVTPPMSATTTTTVSGPDSIASDPAPVASSTPTTAPASNRTRHALIAEDSITARIFLTRQLEQRGFVVHAVGTAAELDALLPSGPWTLVCVDIELPDARGREFIVEMGRRSALAGARLIVLVRDADDEGVARSAGVGVTLRKPFERVHLDHAIAGLAAPAADDRSAR